MPGPCNKGKEKKVNCESTRCDMQKKKGGGNGWSTVQHTTHTHSMGPNILMPRTCVSLPFMWFASMITWRMYACIGLLIPKKKKREGTVSWVGFVEILGCRTHNPSPSSFGSAETSNVIHPSGRSSVTARTSCRSPGLVPARTESAAGV